MTHDPRYVDTLTSADQIKRDFVTGKGNGSHMEHQFDLDLPEEQLPSPTDDDQVVPDPLQEESMVATSDEVHICRCIQLCRLL